MSLDATFLFVLASFVFFMLAMRAIFFEPIRKIKLEREHAITSEREGALALTQQQADLLAKYEAALTDARRKAQQVILERRQEAKKSASETVVKAREEAAGSLDAQMRDLAAWREQSYVQLAGQRHELARIIVNKVSGGKVAASVEG